MVLSDFSLIKDHADIFECSDMASEVCDLQSNTPEGICAGSSLNQDWQNVEVGWMEVPSNVSLLLCGGKFP